MSQLLLPRNKNIGPSDLDNAADFCLATLAQIIWSWQYCRLLVGNIANGIASNFFLFLTELGNFKQKFFLEAMPLAMLPTKSLQHCHDQMIRANVLTDTSISLKIIEEDSDLFSIILKL